MGNYQEQLIADLENFIINPYAIAHAHVAIEDLAIERRDARTSFPFRANGIHVNEADGAPSSALRIPTDEAVKVVLRALARYVAGERDPRVPTES